MAMFAGILDKIRTKKKALALNAQDAYYELLKEVASGKEVDVDEAAIVIDAAAKSEDGFESDVRTMEQRFALAEQLKARHELDRSLPGLSAKLEAAQRELNDAVNKLQPQVQAAYQQLRAAENQLLCLSNVDAKLSESCLDKSLVEKESELLAQRMAIHQKRRPLHEDLERAKAYLSTCRSGLAGERSKTKILPLSPTAPGVSHQEHHWKTELKHQEKIVAQLSEAVAGLDAELVPITKELAEVALKKLVP